ncbi:MAG TPA: hypothetical protein VN939_17590 [Chthoniobacterales bacterium]|jgi:hypothetical protein|nr:hypothetical protein [Chthoniobacterales bacterium]
MDESHVISAVRALERKLVWLKLRVHLLNAGAGTSADRNGDLRRVAAPNDGYLVLTWESFDSEKSLTLAGSKTRGYGGFFTKA